MLQSYEFKFLVENITEEEADKLLCLMASIAENFQNTHAIGYEVMEDTDGEKEAK